MSTDRLQFPDGFLWGASTAGHQVEGGNINADLWPLEWQKPTLFEEPSGATPPKRTEGNAQMLRTITTNKPTA